MLRPFGLGPAVFSAIAVIVLFLILGVAAGRLKGLTAVIGITILSSALFSAIAFWPTFQPGEPAHQQGPIDYLFLPRIALLIFLFYVLVKTLMQAITHGLLGVSKVQSVASRSVITRPNNYQ